MNKKNETQIDNAFKGVEDSMRYLRDTLREVVKEPENKKQAVECGNEDEFDFIMSRLDYFSTVKPCFNDFKGNVGVLLDGSGTFDVEYVGDRQLAPFEAYVAQENIQKKYSESLLPKIEIEYKEGDRFDSAYSDSIHGKNTGVVEDTVFASDLGVSTGNQWLFYLHENKWAEKLTPIFTTEDGVDVYEGERLRFIVKGDPSLEISNAECDSASKIDVDYIYFSTQKAAEQWVKDEGERRGEKDLFLNMQYYMEYCQSEKYVTPEVWLKEHKHFK